MATSTMKAAQYRQTSEDIASLELVDVEIPTPVPGAVVVKVKSAAVNPIDHKVMAGHMIPAGWSLPLPFTMGYDFSGIVAAVHADDQSSFKVGDAVFAVNWGSHKHDDDTSTPGGAFAEFILVSSSKLSKKPEGVTFEQAAAVALVGTTARQVTLDCAAVKNSQKVLVFGGATAVGSIVIQLAKQQGAWVATTASSRTNAYVQQFGADSIIDYTAEKWEDLDILKGIDVVIDTVGEADAFRKVRERNVLKETGRFVSIASLDAGFDPAAHPPLEYAAFFALENRVSDQDALAADLAAGALKLQIDNVFPFTAQGITDLVGACKAGKAMGKLVLNVSA
eukprot:m.270752 g.270752  ORF g.270752 m.270752 type:complete len:337 (-) comp19741_c0_seq2:499-1509(-)